MFFQINVTPKDKKLPELQPRSPESNYTLLLAPFQPPTRIRLDAKINSRVQCTLKIKNSYSRALLVSTTKVPPQERNVLLSCNELSIEPNSEANIDISWEPRESGTWRDILQLSDSRRIKYDVSLTFTCIDINKKNSKGGSKQKRTAKPTTSHPLQNSQKSSNNIATFNRAKSKPNERKGNVTVGLPNKENVPSNFTFDWTFESSKTSKVVSEVKLPQSDFSKILDSSNFKFTPVRSQKFNEFESNVLHDSINNEGASFFKKESSTALENEDITALRKETYITVPKFLNVENIQNEQVRSENVDEFDDSLSPRTSDPVETVKCQNSKQPKSNFSMILNEIQFTPLKNPVQRNDNVIFSPNHCSTAQKPGKNKFLKDDSINFCIDENATFAIDIPSNSEMLKPEIAHIDKVNLKPTCLASTFDQSIDLSIKTKLPMSKGFDLYSEAKNLSMQKDAGSVQDCLEADLWIKPRNIPSSPANKQSMNSTLDSIAEEAIDSKRVHAALNESLETLKNQSKMSKATCLEISPPKKSGSTKKSPLRKVSPTKYSKIKKDKPATEIINAKKRYEINNSIKSSGKVPGVPGVSISKLDLTALLKNKANKSLENSSKQTKEKSVKLRDPNDFMAMFCNPDPFAATMTHDPFLASSLYYDDKWIFVQEIEFKKWLNALLTPPENLATDIESALIDVGKVWQSVRTKQDVALAETKESISARYHTNARLNSLRKAACLMFQRQEMVMALSQTTICVEKEILIIRSDKDLHRDIGLQKIILELFLSYNPLWLRIGLEAVYGETIPLQSNNDLIGLSRFILTRFFSDPFLVKAHSSNLHPNIRLKTFAALMNKFMLKKFLFLVFFLDYAKRNKLIGHDPCLFHKKAALKDSRSILLTFSRELLSGIGDITKILRNHSYVVSYKQTYLDEFDYAVSNLCTDLRDGVRLCRVMELITGRPSLTDQCRVPAISRLQKIHNVGVALCTLKDFNYTIRGEIDAKSIADGHREKTMSLIWQIIHKFQAPRFEKAASTLQRWWRSKLWYVSVRNLLRNRKHNAASVIQRAWRCRKARSTLRQLKSEHALRMELKSEAARKIQAHWRARQRAQRQKQTYQVAKSSAITLQRWWRRVRATRPYVDALQREKRLVVGVQRRWRATRLMKRDKESFDKLKESVIKVQLKWRARALGKKARRDLERQRSAITVLQRRWRATLLANRERERYEQKVKSSKLIQRWWRRNLQLKKDRDYFLSLKNAVKTIEEVWILKHTVSAERSEFLLKKHSARIIQRAYRNYRATVDDVSQLKRARESCVKIQSWCRGAIARKNYQRIRSSCVVIQNWWKSTVATNEQRSEFLRLKHSTIVIQRRWRVKLARNEYLKRKSAVLKIEAWYTNAIMSRQVRRDYLKVQSAASRIKTWWSAVKLGKIIKSRYLKTKRASICLQRRWRARKSMRKTREEYLKLRRSAVKIQSWWRMISEKNRHKIRVSRNNAALVLQRRWRALQTGRVARAEYLRKRSSIVNFQVKWRATLQARSVRGDFLKKRAAAIVLQKNWRSYAASKRFKRTKNAVRSIEKARCHQLAGRRIRAEFLRAKAAAITLQRFWATKQQARLYQSQRRSAVVVQKYWRGYASRKKYERTRAAVVLVQRWARHVSHGKEVRSRYVALRQAAIKLQRKWRAQLTRKEFVRKRKASVVIQKTWRCYAASKKYAEMKRAAVTLQRRRRHVLEGRKAREAFVELRKCAIAVQSLWRMKLQRRAYRKNIEAAVVVQKNWRRIVATRGLRRKKSAVLLIERWRQSILLGRRVRREYVEKRRCIVSMQRMVRVKRQANWFKRQRNAAIKIQRFWRSILEMRECKREYELLKNSAIVIQRRYRAWQIGEDARHKYYYTLTCVVKIQRWYRLQLHLRRVKMMEEQIKWSVNVIENWWIRVSKELRERRLLHAAATRIQAAWRGYKVRQAACNKLIVLREKAKKATEAAVPSATLASRLQENIEIFQDATSIGQLSVCLASLDVITRLLPNACINFCQLRMVDKLYSILAQANRSLPWLDVCCKDISILLTLAKFRATTAYVLKEEYIEVLARLLTISVDKKEDLFLNTATLIWTLTKNEEYLLAMRTCSRTKYLLSSLYNSINKKIAKPSLNISRCKTDALPSPKPDWGLKHKRPRTFSNVSQAINAIALRLNILNIAQTADAQRSLDNFST